MMSADLFKGYAEVDAAHNVMVLGLSQDSHKVEYGDAFFAFRGSTHHGLEFVQQIQQRGARMLAWEPPYNGEISTGIPSIEVPLLAQYGGEIASRFYDYPSSSMEVIAITGTNGKTSVSHFLAQALNQDQQPAAVMGTLGNGFLDDLTYTGYTTPNALDLQQDMAALKIQGVKTICMEVSSHALAQKRVAGMHFNTAVFTNLSRDHLDYHESMDAYAAAKKELLYWPNLDLVVMNIDEPVSRQWLDKWDGCENVWLYGLRNHPSIEKVQQTVIAREVSICRSGMRAKIDTPFGTAELNLVLAGRFNLSNALAVLTVLLARGLDLDTAVRHINQLSPVHGRMQLIAGKTQVVVDFSHTPAALAQTLSALREQTAGRLFCVIGCGGGRDIGKRPLIGKIAVAGADHVWITDDNPRYEDPFVIIQHILAGIENQTDVSVVQPREKAIAAAINQATKDDVVLLAGKGHETWQEIRGVKHQFSDSFWAQKINCRSES